MSRWGLLGMCFALAGCERVVDLDVDEGPKRLVVEARLERIRGAVSGNQVIRLTTTAPYFSAATPPPAQGAVVRVTDDAGHVVTFAESATAGVYTTDQLVVATGRRYTLSVTFEGQQYASSEVAQSVPAIDSIYLEPPKPGRFSGTEGVRATIDLMDPAGERNYYLWDQYVDGVRQLGPDSTFKYRMSASDDLVDGLPILGFQPYEGVDIPVGSQVLIRQIGISETILRYYFALSGQVGADPSPFGVPPGSVRGNVANVADPTRFALGYFYVSEVSEARLVRP